MLIKKLFDCSWTVANYSLRSFWQLKSFVVVPFGHDPSRQVIRYVNSRESNNFSRYE